MSQIKYSTVHYRKLFRDNDDFPPSFPLSKAISKALQQKKNGVKYSQDWQLRRMPTPNDETKTRFINEIHIDDASVFGVLCVFTPEQMHALIELQRQQKETSADDTSALVSNVDIAETKAPIGTEYLDGIAYWLVIEDHCYIVQHTAVQTKVLEEYLTWLLRNETSTIDQNHIVVLRADFDLGSVGGNLDNIKSVEIGGLATVSVEDFESPATEITESIERRSVGNLKASFGKALKIVNEILGETKASKIMENMPSEAALDVTVNIGYRTVNRKISPEFMKDLATGLRNAGDGEIKIRSKDGTIKGDEARLHLNMPFRRKRPNGILLELEHAREQLTEVHRRFLSDGKIS